MVAHYWNVLLTLLSHVKVTTLSDHGKIDLCMAKGTVLMLEMANPDIGIRRNVSNITIYYHSPKHHYCSVGDKLHSNSHTFGEFTHIDIFPSAGTTTSVRFLNVRQAPCPTG